jgi:dolichyl-phosphate-mannose--protein O-mannosyl transferase
MRIKHNDLAWYFIRPHDQLPDAYLRSCKKFFKELSDKQQATSVKHQARQNSNYFKPGLRVKNRFNRKV